MTDEQINKKIAEACGWKRVPETLGLNLWFCPPKPGTKMRRIRSSCPDYCNDLNACHEFAAWMNTEEQVRFMSQLQCVVLEKAYWDWAWRNLNTNEAFELVGATARQRAEAFLRVLNLWEE